MGKKIYGITGPTGSGKTLASSYLVGKGGFTVINCDEVARILRETNDAMRSELIQAFGTVYAHELADVVFTDADQLAILNDITHKYILKEIEILIDKTVDEHIVVDGALLLESGFAKKCEKIIAITAPLAVRVKHIMARDGLTLTQAVSRMSSQNDDDFYTKKADIVIVNDRDELALKDEIEKAFDFADETHAEEIYETSTIQEDLNLKSIKAKTTSAPHQAVYAGTFSPPTVGHLDVIKRAAESYFKLYVVVMDNPAKKPDFTAAERVALLKKATAGLQNVVIESFSGLLAEYAHTKYIDISIKGIRNGIDLASENEQAYFNRQIAIDNGWEPLKPIFIPTSHENFYVSSGNIRVMLKNELSRETAKRYIPKEIWNDVIEKYRKNS